MLDRSRLILIAVPAGLAAGALAWALLGGAASGAKGRLTRVEGRLEALHVAAPRRGVAAADYAPDALAHPLFSVGGAALAEATVRVDGLALTPRRAAALVSINGKPAEWLERGATRDGVTLQDVKSDKVVIDTATGPREVGLAEATQPASAPASGPASAPHR